MKIKAENPGIYLKHTKLQLEYMNQHCGVMTDTEVGINIGISRGQVEYYRTQVLKRGNPNGRPIESGWNIVEVQEELNALLLYYASYNGCMMDSLKHRIKYLSKKIGL